MKLLLFDIDGTLVKGGADVSHRASFSYATEKVFGIPVDLNDISTPGKIDSQILIELLELKGLSSTEIKEKSNLLFNHMTEYFKENTINLEKFVLPNVLTVLKELQKRDDLILGLLTGNVGGIGWAKVENAGLKNFFKLGVFGDEAFKRTDLVPSALKKVEEYNIKPEDTYIIGDTPRDVQCAKETGCISVAIPTGKYSLEELNKESPDYLLTDIIELVDIV